MAQWYVTAAGDAPPELHAELADRAGKMLALGKYGTTASQFSGEGVNGPVHEKPADDGDGEDEPGE